MKHPVVYLHFSSLNLMKLRKQLWFQMKVSLKYPRLLFSLKIFQFWIRIPKLNCSIFLKCNSLKAIEALCFHVPWITKIRKLHCREKNFDEDRAHSPNFSPFGPHSRCIETSYASREKHLAGTPFFPAESEVVPFVVRWGDYFLP